MEIRIARRTELAEAALVLARGMRDNPNQIAAYGPDPVLRYRRLERTFSRLLPVMPHPPWVGLEEGKIVAVWGTAAPGTCRFRLGQRLRMLPALLGCGLSTTRNILAWMGDWESRDPDQAHWHLGPVAVDRPLQGQGIGSRMMAAWCDMLDQHSAAAYLETDKPENVRFYR
ncbi:MAG: GNAT family N-acetyltransferase, partial [Deltaproteobacteria bacterium]